MGLDLSTGGFELTGTVENYILRRTIDARNYLFKNRLQETRNVMLYLFAFNEEWRDAFIEYVAKFIEAKLYILEDKVIDDAISSSKLNVYYFTSNIIYEVNESELEW